jgi:molybdopterin-guanine dinucleotide biosynthesis protein A
MTSKEHKKHADITKPCYGNFAHSEWAIVGGQCTSVRNLAEDIFSALSHSYKCAYLDTQHTNKEDEIIVPSTINGGAVIECISRICYHQFNFRKTLGKFQYRQLCNDADLVLVNGNHYEAKAQIVVIDKTKESSLEKRLSQLNNVQLILLADNNEEIFYFVKESLPEWQKIPVYHLGETGKIINFFKEKMEQSIPLLNGLILSGGKSIRMGVDKSLIDWNGKEQRYYLADLLAKFCNDVFISCRADQKDEIAINYKTIVDTFTGLGPYGAILSAFREQPDCAWIIIACDIPLLDANTLKYLAENRNTSAMATAFESPYDGFPEALITIWEPKSYPVLLSFLSQGYTCPRKVLRNNDVNIIKAPDPETLMNVNRPEDAETVRKIIDAKHTHA